MPKRNRCLWSVAALVAVLAADETPGAGNPVPVDRDGHPLPRGALARIGSARLSHGAQVNRLAFAPDGKILASAGQDRTIRLWQTSTGKEVRRIVLPPPRGE